MLEHANFRPSHFRCGEPQGASVQHKDTHSNSHETLPADTAQRAINWILIKFNNRGWMQTQISSALLHPLPNHLSDVTYLKITVATQQTVPMFVFPTMAEVEMERSIYVVTL